MCFCVIFKPSWPLSSLNIAIKSQMYFLLESYDSILLYISLTSVMILKCFQEFLHCTRNQLQMKRCKKGQERKKAYKDVNSYGRCLILKMFHSHHFLCTVIKFIAFFLNCLNGHCVKAGCSCLCSSLVSTVFKSILIQKRSHVNVYSWPVLG